MGYARSRGYYFDKLNLKPAQAEFLLRAYDEKFFEDAAAAKSKYLEQADKFMGGEFKDFITAGALNGKKVKEFLVGKDWTQGGKKMWKLMQVLGTAYFLGGGLGSPLGIDILKPSTYTPFLKDGAAIATHNAKQVVNAVSMTAGALSKASGVAINTITGNLVPGAIAAKGGIQELATNAHNALTQPPYK